MTDGSRSPISLRQILWVAAGAAILTFLVAVASWLFSPRSSQDAGGTASTSIQETTLDKKTFTPEPTGPGRTKESPASIPPSGTVREVHTGPEPTTPPVPPPQPPASAPSDHAVSKRPGYGIQVGAFSSAVNALQIKQRLDASGFHASILTKAEIHKVVVTGFADRAAAEKTLADLRHKGFPKAFIVPVE
jgi:cell division septation protein DedD